MSMSMSARERDKKMSDMASIAADEFCKQHTDPSVSEANIRSKPEWYLEHTVPFLTVRALHRHEEALARHGNALTSLEVDSRSIKRLTRVLVGLTVVLAILTFALALLCFAFGHRTPSTIKRIAYAITDTQSDSDTISDTMIGAAWQRMFAARSRPLAAALFVAPRTRFVIEPRHVDRCDSIDSRKARVVVFKDLKSHYKLTSWEWLNQ